MLAYQTLYVYSAHLTAILLSSAVVQKPRHVLHLIVDSFCTKQSVVVVEVVAMVVVVEVP